MQLTRPLWPECDQNSQDALRVWNFRSATTVRSQSRGVVSPATQPGEEGATRTAV